ncbi:cobalt-precorrin-6A reductase [Mesorhizobium sp. LSJC264A00]|uniref:cobalt-precorrin-6A reductase n=1 Tax=unclassified Mesorhizobium TaxID=325217 RepID=UPI0003CDF1D4|nr:cobalt-precorrin-6A reductase [Mesorhizobium sp. LSJC264A00]ESX25784.1 cobalt-precorrin-6x reductase [Mesorhizobium sp. LSJC264A00]
MTHRILILGGTSEARHLAGKLAARSDLSVTLSLAGRTESPVAQGVPVRSGGFGGADGLAAYLREAGIDLLIDATHPYAAQISANAAQASRLTGVPILALRRPGWKPVDGDRWTQVDTTGDAVHALGSTPRRAFLALGRQEVAAFEAAPQHHYLIRSVDPVEPKLAVPDATYLLARGPFREADERALLEEHRIDGVVSKNSGGEATYGKIAAARALGIEVVMVRRPILPEVPSAETVEALAAMIDHGLDPVAERGV